MANHKPVIPIEPAVPVPAQELQTQPVVKQVINPAPGEMITSFLTGNTYTIGAQIGEGHFGVVFACTDLWQNELAAKVLKPISTYEDVKTRAEAEFKKLLHVRNPFITFVFDAFEYRDTFYIITERCYCPISHLFTLDNFKRLSLDQSHLALSSSGCSLPAPKWICPPRHPSRRCIRNSC